MHYRDLCRDWCRALKNTAGRPLAGRPSDEASCEYSRDLPCEASFASASGHSFASRCLLRCGSRALKNAAVRLKPTVLRTEQGASTRVDPRAKHDRPKASLPRLSRRAAPAFRAPRVLALAPLLLLLSGCNDMWQQPKYLSLAPSKFYDDGASARPLVAGVVAREDPRTLTTFDTGRTGNNDATLSTNIPIPITARVLARGQERYNINCSPCHGFDGYGRGIVVQRGFPSPPSYHIARLRNAPAGHFYDVISNGYGAMYSYADRVKPADRWAITAYIRVLQRSQNATISDVPPDQRAKLEAQP